MPCDDGDDGYAAQMNQADTKLKTISNISREMSFRIDSSGKCSVAKHLGS